MRRIAHRKLCFLLAFFLLGLFSSAKRLVANSFLLANSYGAIGETNSLYLNKKKHLFLHPYYNDAHGGTDKLLTGSIRAGYIFDLESSSLDLIFSWKILTPASRAFIDKEDNENPLGRYADWMEVRSSWAYVFTQTQYGTSKIQFSLSGNHVGSKGAKQVHRWVHKVTGNNIYDNTTYIDQPEGFFFNRGLYLAWMFKPLPLEQLGAWQQQVGLGLESGRFITESFISWNHLWNIRQSWWTIATELRLVRQFSSDVYVKIKKTRYELSLASMLYDYYRPSIKYVSPYLRGDSFGQVYFDFINVQVPL